MTNWLQHVQEWKDCQKCPLGQQRHNICFARSEWPPGASRPNLRLPADLLFVGEAPGMSEDTSGLPFTGPAGEHPQYGLNYIISQALCFPQELTYVITNLVLCYPRLAKETDDHRPEHGEILSCRPRLIEFVNLAQPRLIVRIGDTVQRYMNFDSSVPMVDIVHPARVLRLVLAKRNMATNKSIVDIHSAIENVLQSPKQPWKQWGTSHGEPASYESDIPF